MAVYRVYFVDAHGRLEPGEAFYCKTDGEALPRLPRPRLPAVRAELWQGGRFVALAASTPRGRRESDDVLVHLTGS
jgi:hypothetical protein